MERGGGGCVCEKVGPVVNWASRYYCHYIRYVNQYACGFSSFLAFLVFFVLCIYAFEWISLSFGKLY